MLRCCSPWKICYSKRIKRICCKPVAQRLKRHRCRYRHAVHPFQISVINSIYRQHRWHRTQAKRTIIITPLPTSWIHWISIHLRIYCERFVCPACYTKYLGFILYFFFVRFFWGPEFVQIKHEFCVYKCETRYISKSDRVHLNVSH